jgi:XcyI restriction endonuclease
MGRYAAEDARRILATAGIRDEFVFPVPTVLRTAPQLVGYYRLLLGRPQKSFYGTDGFGTFRSMEIGGVMTARQQDALPGFCDAMGASFANLVRGISPRISVDDIEQLPLLTLGSQFQGANNNTIGIQATRQIWLAILELVPADKLLERSEHSAVVLNSAQREVSLQLGSDPDLQIREEVGVGEFQNKVAIEIKGGTDRSNAYNRAGEAEKSHIKARKAGYQDCWTVISIEGVDRDRLESGSPSTSSWFDISQVLARDGVSWVEFTRRIAVAVGIPLAGGRLS